MVEYKSASSNTSDPSSTRTRETKVRCIFLDKMHEVGLLSDNCCAGSHHGVDRVSEVPRSIEIVIIELGDNPSIGCRPPYVKTLSEAEVGRCVDSHPVNSADDGFDIRTVEPAAVAYNNEATLDALLSLHHLNDMAQLIGATSDTEDCYLGLWGRLPVDSLFEQAAEYSNTAAIRLLSKRVEKVGLDEFAVLPSSSIMGVEQGEPALRMGKFVDIPFAMWVRYEAAISNMSQGEVRIEHRLNSIFTVTGSAQSEYDRYGLGVGLQKEF